MENWAEVHTQSTYGAVSDYRFVLSTVPKLIEFNAFCWCLLLNRITIYVMHTTLDAILDSLNVRHIAMY